MSADEDEFGALPDNAAEAGLAFNRPQVERIGFGGLSAIRWGAGEPEVVFLHGGAQNAHTWDTVALALGKPALAIDLPGHGRSAWWDDHGYTPARLAAAVAPAIEELAPDLRLLVGMSLGGLAAMVLAATRPSLVPKLAIVDVTPGTDATKARAIIDFTSGPARFPSFEAIIERTVEHNPARSIESLRRGVRHNAHELPGGSWTWRYDPVRNWGDGVMKPEFSQLWDAVRAITCPALLVRGARSPVVDDEDAARFLSLQPAALVVSVEGAGHSIQGDRPVELAGILADFLEEPR